MAGKLGNLQALRGLACLYVVLFHAGGWERAVTYAPKPFFRAFTYSGYAGVDLFFVISGFILTWINWNHLGHRQRLRAHLLRRAWRIYPLLWLAWLVTLGCFLAVTGGAPDRLAVDLPHALLLTRPPAKDIYVVLPHAWTLAFEVMFYAAFGLAFLAPRRWFVPLLYGWTGACLFNALSDPGAGGTLTEDYALRPYVLEFLAGCGVAVLVRQGVQARSRTAIGIGIGWFLTATVLEALGVTRGQYVPVQRVLLFGPPSVLLVYGLVTWEHTTGRVLPRWLQKTGDASYSIYLFHYPVLFAVTLLTLHWGHRTKPHLVWAFLTVGGGVAVGFVMHALVERPLLALPGWLARKFHKPAVTPVEEPRPTEVRRAA
jgi:peptidoglycan/LPS O-acetylase OafA/YrhL